MNYWLLKTEPSTYAWNDLVKDRSTCWSGIRNFLARNNLREMKKGEQAFLYHSVHGKKIIGIVEVIREAYPDPTIVEGDWVAIDIKPIKEFKKYISLDLLKKEKGLEQMMLLRQGRLSVCKLTQEEFEIITNMSNRIDQ